jgi:hypothetical protein
MADPWMKFYPSDWRSEPRLRLVSMAARGLWVEMLCIMHESDPRGDLTVGGVALDAAKLARMVGESEEMVSALLAELKEAGVYSTRKNGVIFSRRMEKDEIKRRKLRENGRKGGNPSLRKDTGIDALDNQADKPTEARSQKPDTRDTNVSKEHARKKRGEAYRLSDDWQIPEEWIDEAVSRGFTRDRAYAEADRMRNWSQSSPKGAKVNWRSAWRNWIADKADQQTRPADRQQSNTDRRRSAWLDVVDEIEREGAGRNTLEPGGARSVAYLPRARSGDA